MTTPATTTRSTPDDAAVEETVETDGPSILSWAMRSGGFDLGHGLYFFDAAAAADDPRDAG
jgi:hypothetical protein